MDVAASASAQMPTALSTKHLCTPPHPSVNQRTNRIAREVGVGAAGGGARAARGLPSSCSSNPCVTCGASIRQHGARVIVCSRAGAPELLPAQNAPEPRSQRRRPRPLRDWLPAPWLLIASRRAQAVRGTVGGSRRARALSSSMAAQATAKRVSDTTIDRRNALIGPKRPHHPPHVAHAGRG